MDTEPTIEAQLLAHAERQTALGERQAKALENINWVVMALFVIGLIAVAIAVVS